MENIEGLRFVLPEALMHYAPNPPSRSLFQHQHSSLAVFTFFVCSWLWILCSFKFLFPLLMLFYNLNLLGYLDLNSDIKYATSFLNLSTLLIYIIVLLARRVKLSYISAISVYIQMWILPLFIQQNGMLVFNRDGICGAGELENIMVMRK